MADADPLLDDYLNEEDKALLADVAAPEPALEVGAGPVPEDIDEIAPQVAAAPEPPPEDQAAPDQIDATAALPGAQAAPQDPIAAVTSRTIEQEGIARRQGEEDKAKADIGAQTAERMAEAARLADEDARLERADYLDRRKAAEQDLEAKTKAYESTKLEKPRHTWKSRLAVIFGGLGAAFRSAGGGSSENAGLKAVQQQWHDETEIQKANIATLRDSAVQARTRLADVDDGRRSMMRDADARLLSKYNMALRQGESQLKARGIPQAGIDADKRIALLRAGRDAAILQARKDEDQHALMKARAAALQARAARDLKKKGGGGPARSAAEAAITDMAERGVPLSEATRQAGPGVKPETVRKIYASVSVAGARADKAENADAEKTVHIGTERKPAQAPTKKSAEDYRVFESSAQQVEGALEMLAENYKKYGIEITSALPSILQSKAARERAAIMESIVLPAKEVGRLGALAGPDKTILVNITGGNAAQLLGDDVGIKGIRAWLGRARTGALNSLGIAPDAPASQAKTSTPATKAGPAAGTIVRPRTGPHAGKTLRARADGGFDVVSDGRR